MTTNNDSVPIDWVERAAMSASLLCLVHCLALPFLLAALPALATIIPLSESFHLWVLAFAVPASAIALLSGMTRHGTTWLLAPGTIGLTLLASGAIPFGTTRWETPLTIVGSLILAGTHLLNWRLRHAAR